MVKEIDNNELIEKAVSFFKKEIIDGHLKKMVNDSIKLCSYNINPFLVKYLSSFFNDSNTERSIARALIYPRVLGTSINTIFGSKIQKMINEVLKESYGSTTSGIDIEFIDKLDGRKKFCQLKAGPSTINKDDVETIRNHFKKVVRLGIVNNKSIQYNDLIVGVIYGTNQELNGNYRKLKEDYPVFVGEELWYHLTGDQNFYFKLIHRIGEIAMELDLSNELSECIDKLEVQISSRPEYKN